jgi:hypothetical protein
MPETLAARSLANIVRKNERFGGVIRDGSKCRGRIFTGVECQVP